MAKRTATNIVNAINAEIKKVYRYELPAVTAQNFSDMAAELRQAPEVVQNAWHDMLVNLVGMQIIKNKRTYESYFRALHQGEIKTFDVQLLMVDIIAAKTYTPDANADDFFADEKPEVMAQYSNRVCKLKFPVSINEENLYGAFISEGAFDNYMNAIETALWSSLEMADVELTKKTINENIEQGNIYLIPGVKPTDKDTALAFTNRLKGIAYDMQAEMSNRFNLSGMTTWTPPEDGVVITTTDMRALSETYTLPWAFHNSFLELSKDGQGITMASDALAGGAVYGIYADRYAFEIRNIVGFPKTASQYFGNTLTLKRWLHYWALYTISYFNNCAAFIDENAVGITAATLDTRSGSKAANRGAVVYNIVDSITKSAGKYGDKFGTWSVTGAESADTVIDTYNGRLYIGKDETAESVTVTWTSHLNQSITAQQVITING